MNALNGRTYAHWFILVYFTASYFKHCFKSDAPSRCLICKFSFYIIGNNTMNTNCQIPNKSRMNFLRGNWKLETSHYYRTLLCATFLIWVNNQPPFGKHAMIAFWNKIIWFLLILFKCFLMRCFLWALGFPYLYCLCW